MTGINGNYVPALPLQQTVEIMRKQGRIAGTRYE